MRQLVHRLIWQRLPRRFRRDLLLRITQALAPRPILVPERSNRIVVAGYLRTSSGLGESARLCYEALQASGADVSGVDLSRPMMQDQGRADFRFKDGSQLAGTGTLILHINAPWIPFALTLLGRHLVRDKRIVGYWHWELPEAPKDWRIGSRFVHEIWVPSYFIAEALERSKFRKPIRIIPHPVALRVPVPRIARERTDRPFVVLVVFNMASGLTRKNPLAAIEAFRHAFGDDVGARLVIKVSNPQHYQPGLDALLTATRGIKNIELLTRPLSPTEMHTLYDEADVVMSLHRSEGFGFVIAEAMLHGIPVIATDWSGNCDFLKGSNGVPVRWRPVSASDPQWEYDRRGLTWADPDIRDASTKLRTLRNNPSLRAALGRQAREDAADMFSLSRYYKAITEILDDTVARETQGQLVDA